MCLVYLIVCTNENNFYTFVHTITQPTIRIYSLLVWSVQLTTPDMTISDITRHQYAKSVYVAE